MRLFQNAFVLLSATAFGLGLGAMTVDFGLSILFKPPQGESFGGAFAWLGMIVCGGAAGALIGFVSAIRWISHHENPIWTLAVWIGLVAGMAVGLLATYLTSGRYFLWFWLIRASFYVSASGAVGAFIARFGFGGKASKPKPKRRR